MQLLHRARTLSWGADCSLTTNPNGAANRGYTPEGLDQNPAYYEMLQEAAFKAAPEPNTTSWLVQRAHRRYGLMLEPNADVAAAWTALGASGYAVDKGVSDATGVCQMDVASKLHLDTSMFATDLHTPKPALCLEWAAWGSLNAVAAAYPAGAVVPAPFVYDLVNTAREVYV